MEAPEGRNGATDLEIDPQNPSVLYAAFWSDAIYKSTNGGASWTQIMNGIPASPAQHAGNLTRFSIAISHPNGAGPRCSTRASTGPTTPGTTRRACSSRPTPGRAGR